MDILIEKLPPHYTCIIDNEERHANQDGNILVDTDIIAKRREKDPLEGYTNQLADILSGEERVKLYIHMGNSSSIMIYDTARIIDKDIKLTKDILMWGIEYGVLCRGTNNTWKVMNGEYKNWMLNYVKESTKKITKPETDEERRTRREHAYQETQHTQHKGGGHERGIDKVKRIIKEQEIIKATIRSRENIQKELTVWEERLNDPQYSEKNSIVERINALKQELRTLPLQASSATKQTLPKKKPAPLLSPVPGKNPSKLLK